MLSSALPLMAHDLRGVTALSLMSCGRLFQQITHHLGLGATIVVVDAQSPEQQLGVSRVLLDSKCDLLLTHDGAQTCTPPPIELGPFGGLVRFRAFVVLYGPPSGALEVFELSRLQRPQKGTKGEGSKRERAGN